MTQNGKLPIAETFLSPQGEGLHSGTLMLFVRIAGCSVGKRMTLEESVQFAKLENSPLAIYRETCTIWDGRKMACDTDFRTKEVLTVDEILARVPDGVEHICITGGEPLNYDLTELLMKARQKWLDCHIETSGTVPIEKAYPDFNAIDLLNESLDGWIWVTVSPKFGCLPEMIDLASELKFLVDGDFDPAKIPEAAKHKNLVFLQPINYEYSVHLGNLQRCLSLQKQFPHWRISSQAHKIWNVR